MIRFRTHLQMCSKSNHIYTLNSYVFFRRHREVARKKPAAATAVPAAVPPAVPPPLPVAQVPAIEVPRTPPTKKARSRTQAAGSPAPAPMDDS